ncbi:MAG: AAA family ATPase [Thermoguttaceae bacterium]|jgi:type II secretory pathway predicted ATPase ExeA
MYQAHWGLKEQPFRGCVDAKSFYQSPTHEEALARLNFLVEQHRRLGLLIGPSGSGKSLVLEVFAQQLRRRGRSVAKLSLLGVEPAEMLSLLATEWELPIGLLQSPPVLWRALTNRLIEHRYQQLETVVLLDDVDQADPRTLQHVARLVRFDPSPDMRLTVVLAGRQECLGKLGQSLLSLADLRIDVEPWQRADTEQYVTTLLSQAGRCTPVFAEPAFDRLHELAHGIPRRVSQLAGLALLAGAGQNLSQIDARVVEEAYQELCVVG